MTIGDSNLRIAIQYGCKFLLVVLLEIEKVGALWGGYCTSTFMSFEIIVKERQEGRKEKEATVWLSKEIKTEIKNT